MRLVVESGVYELRGSIWNRLGPPLIGDQGVSGIAQADDGSLYVCYRNDNAGTGYVERWKNGKFHRIDHHIPQLGNRHFESVFVASDGRIWFGTHDDGVFILDDDSVHQLNMRDGLASSLVSSIFESSDGSIWIGYRRTGVSNYRDELFLHFGQSEGLPSWDIRRFSEDHHGNVWVSIEPRNRWFPTQRRGIYRYEPERDPPDTRIDAYPTQPLSPHGIGVFSFSGTDAWNDTQRHSLFYSWRFVPLDSVRSPLPWSTFGPITSMVTDKSPLASGRYRFEVRAADLRGNIDPTPASALFDVSPPFWKRRDAQVAAALLSTVIMALLLSVSQKHISLRKSNRKLTQERDRKERAERACEQYREQLYQSQKLEALGTLAAGIAHDFNNYLMAIVGYTEVLRIQSRNADQVTCLDGIVKATDQAKKVTGALRTFSRRDTSSKKPQNLNHIVRDTLFMLRSMLPASIDIESDLDPSSVLSVKVDANQIQQAIVNLAINSRDAMPDGGKLAVTVLGG